MELLLNPEVWMETPVGTVATAMTESGVSKLKLEVGNGAKAVFALVVISGENTQAILDAMASKERELEADEV